MHVGDVRVQLVRRAAEQAAPEDLSVNLVPWVDLIATDVQSVALALSLS